MIRPREEMLSLFVQAYFLKLKCKLKNFLLYISIVATCVTVKTATIIHFCPLSRLVGLLRTCHQTRSTWARWRGRVTWPTWSWMRRSSRACWTCPPGWPSTVCAATRPPSGWVPLLDDRAVCPGFLLPYRTFMQHVTSAEVPVQVSNCRCLFALSLPVCVMLMLCCNYKAHIRCVCGGVCWASNFIAVILLVNTRDQYLSSFSPLIWYIFLLQKF